VRTTRPVAGIRLSLWRAVALFRLVTLLVCLFLIVKWQPIYARPAVAAATGAAMAAWTALLGRLAVRGRAHRAPLVVADVVVTAGLTLLTIPAQTAAQQHGAMVTLTTIWAAGPAIEAAFLAGPLGGIATGALQYAVSAFVADQWSGRTLYSGVLLVLTGAVVGFVAQVAVRAEEQLRAATAAQAALAERERLAGSIHDGVLQVLGLVQRKGRDAGGEWSAIAVEAGVQEEALRRLITVQAPPRDGDRDLAGELRALRSARVTVSTPAGEVPLPADRAAELCDAVGAALQNVARHAGEQAHAWVLLETLDDALRVTVRDDGAGFDPVRLDDAERGGRLGVAHSIRGRIAGLGGRCTVTSAPGEGTEIEMIVPW
jgi:signal transduction histidine kinase